MNTHVQDAERQANRTRPANRMCLVFLNFKFQMLRSRGFEKKTFRDGRKKDEDSEMVQLAPGQPRPSSAIPASKGRCRGEVKGDGAAAARPGPALSPRPLPQHGEITATGEVTRKAAIAAPRAASTVLKIAKRADVRCHWALSSSK